MNNQDNANVFLGRLVKTVNPDPTGNINPVWKPGIKPSRPKPNLDRLSPKARKEHTERLKAQREGYEIRQGLMVKYRSPPSYSEQRETWGNRVELPDRRPLSKLNRLYTIHANEIRRRLGLPPMDYSLRAAAKNNNSSGFRVHPKVRARAEQDYEP